MNSLVINLRDLPEGVSRHEIVLSQAWLRDRLAGLDGIAPVEGTGAARLEATRKGRDVLLRGAVEAPLEIVCVRCLEPFTTTVRAELEVLMRPGKTSLDEKTEDLVLEELGEERYTGDEIVLDDILRDLLLLEVPMSPSCGEACPGWDGLTGQGGTE